MISKMAYDRERLRDHSYDNAVDRRVQSIYTPSHALDTDLFPRPILGDLHKPRAF